MKSLTKAKACLLGTLLMCGFVMLTGFSGGGCGPGEPPPVPSNCKSDSDCGAGYRCEMPKAMRALPGCMDAREGSGLKPKCAVAPDAPDTAEQIEGTCIKEKTSNECTTDADCQRGYSCQAEYDEYHTQTRCAGAQDSLGSQTRCGVPAPSRRRCRPNPNPRCTSNADCVRGFYCSRPQVACAQIVGPDGEPVPCETKRVAGFCMPQPPQTRYCDQNSDCRTGEQCIPLPSPMPAPPAPGTEPGDEPAAPPKDDAPVAQDKRDDEPSKNDDKEEPVQDCQTEPQDNDEDKTAPSTNCRRLPVPPPPHRRGICRPAPQRRCQKDADCGANQQCVRNPVEPTPQPLGCAKSSDGTLCDGGAPVPPPTYGVCQDKPSRRTTRKRGKNLPSLLPV